MNKKEFIRQLKKELRKRNVNDIPEILADYEEHFQAKLEEKTEEEIVLELGSISQIADEYAANRYNGNSVSDKKGKPVTYNTGKKPRVWVAVLLIGFDLVFGIAIASIIFSLVVSLAAVAFSFVVGGGFYAVFSFIMFGSVAVKFAGFFASLALVALGLLAAFSIKPVIKGVIALGKQYVKLHKVLIGGRA